MRRFLLQAVLLPALLLNLPAGEVAVPPDEIISLIRNFVGDEAALQSVKSLHYRGTFQWLGEADAVADLELKIAYPHYHWMKVTGRSQTEILISDGFEAYMLRETHEAGERLVELFDQERTQQILANTLENLIFFDYLTSPNIEIVRSVLTEFEGDPVYLIEVLHRGGVRVIRKFDRFSGRLILTETSDEAVSRSSGSLWSSNIRFPEIIETEDSAGGRYLVRFNEVFVNPDIDKAIFSVNPWNWVREGTNQH